MVYGYGQERGFSFGAFIRGVGQAVYKVVGGSFYAVHVWSLDWVDTTIEERRWIQLVTFTPVHFLFAIFDMPPARMKANSHWTAEHRVEGHQALERRLEG